MVPNGHTLPHAPQFPGSVAVATQPLLQFVVPAAQPLLVHAPALHFLLPLHAPPPQELFAAVDVVRVGLVAGVGAAGEACSPRGRLQLPLWQTPPVQTLPQVPQLFGSAWRLAHAGGLSDEHSVRPFSQALQVPPLQVAPAGQTVPQDPQLLGSVWRLVQAPVPLQ